MKASPCNLSDGAIAGICGNIYAESHFNPAARNPNDLGMESLGLCQWRGTRAEKLKKLASANSLTWSDFAVQLTYLINELTQNNTYKSRVLVPLQGTTDFKKASEIWGDKFEVFAGHSNYSGKEHMKRKDFAGAFYDGFVNGKFEYAGEAENLNDVSANTAEEGNGPSNKNDFELSEDYYALYDKSGTIEVDDWNPLDEALIIDVEFNKEDGVFPNSSFPMLNNKEEEAQAQRPDFIGEKKQYQNTLPPVLTQKLKPTIALSEHSVPLDSKPENETSKPFLEKNL